MVKCCTGVLGEDAVETALTVDEGGCELQDDEYEGGGDGGEEGDELYDLVLHISFKMSDIAEASISGRVGRIQIL
jgi:hypothetical protein